MFGPESKLFPRQSKIKGHGGNSQFPGQEAGDIPNWKAKNQYVIDQEIMDPERGTYWRCIQDHYATDIFADDVLNGNWVEMISIPPASSAVNYSNVLWVDPVFGNNSTALPGRFDKPYQTITQATTIAASLGGSTSQRTLIYIRKGLYFGSVNLTNWVDFYCEPGVVFSGSGSVRDNGVSVISNFYGYAKFVSKSSVTFYITGGSTVNFQFDYIDNSSSNCIYVVPPVGSQCNLTIEGNKMFSTTLGVGYAIAFRRKCNVTMTIKNWIRSYHSAIDIRDNFDGLLVINCPQLIIQNDNLYGGNFKQAIIQYSSTPNARVIFNGDIINEMTSFIGGIAGMVTNWSSCYGTIEVNGNIYAGYTYGVYCSGNVNASKIIVNGSIFSKIQPIWVSSYSNCYVRNGVIIKDDPIVGAPVALNQFAKLYLMNTFIYNQQPDGDLINIVDSTNEVDLYNVVGQSEGLLGFSITSVNPVIVKIHGSRMNKPLNATITDALVPSGMIVDPLVVVPKF